MPFASPFCRSLPKVRQPARDGHDPNPAAHCLRLAPTSPQKGPREAAPAAALERRAVGKGARGSRPPSPCIPRGVRVGDAERSGNVPEPRCAAGGGESPWSGRDPARSSAATEQAPHADKSRGRGARTGQTAPQRTRTRGRRLARRPGWDGRHGKFQLVRELYVASAAAAAAAGLEGACGWRWRFPAEPAVPPPAQHLRGQGGGSGGDRGRRGARLWRGAAQPPYRGGVAWPTGAWLAVGAWRPVCAAARALKPGLARPECAFAAWEPSGPASCPVRAVPALLRPGSRLGSEPRAACSGMPRYELALILKAMQRVSDLPLRTRLPARAPSQPLGRRPPPSPPSPRGRRGPGPRAAGGGRPRWGGAWGRPARRGRVRAAAGGCASHAAAGRSGWRAGGRGTGGGAARGSPVEGPREDTRQRPAPARVPRPPSRSCLVAGPAAAARSGPAPPPTRLRLASAGRPGTVRAQ